MLHSSPHPRGKASRSEFRELCPAPPTPVGLSDHLFSQPLGLMAADGPGRIPIWVLPATFESPLSKATSIPIACLAREEEGLGRRPGSPVLKWGNSAGPSPLQSSPENLPRCLGPSSCSSAPSSDQSCTAHLSQCSWRRCFIKLLHACL